MGRGEEGEKQQQSDDTDLLPLAGCWVSGSTHRSAALRRVGRSTWFYKHRSTPSPFVVPSLSPQGFLPFQLQEQYLLRPAQSSECYLFVSLLGLNAYFIILLLSCQYNTGRGLESQATLVVGQAFLHDNTNSGWFPTKRVGTVLCFCYLHCSKQTDTPPTPSYLLKFILQTTISIKLTYFSSVFVLWFCF